MLLFTRVHFCNHRFYNLNFQINVFGDFIKEAATVLDINISYRIQRKIKIQFALKTPP